MASTMKFMSSALIQMLMQLETQSMIVMVTAAWIMPEAHNGAEGMTTKTSFQEICAASVVEETAQEMVEMYQTVKKCQMAMKCQMVEKCQMAEKYQMVEIVAILEFFNVHLSAVVDLLN